MLRRILFVRSAICWISDPVNFAIVTLVTVLMLLVVAIALDIDNKERKTEVVISSDLCEGHGVVDLVVGIESNSKYLIRCSDETVRLFTKKELTDSDFFLDKPANT